MTAQQGTLRVPYRFVTIFIITHGEDLKGVPDSGIFDDKLLKNNHYKLTLSGLTGNITEASDTVDALYSQIPRILAHDRTKSPLQKLQVVRGKMINDFNIEYEEAEQAKAQASHVWDHINKYGGLYQRAKSRNENWFPEPTLITYNRAYSFNANPIDSGVRSRSVQERNQFGVWLLDASLDIATVLGFHPGCETEPLSLLKLLGISLSTARTHDDSDETGTTTTLFIIMAQLMELFGDDIHINVVDVACRYYNWDKHRPGVEGKHKWGRGLQELGEHFSRIWGPLGRAVTYAGLVLTDEVLSAAARPAKDRYFPECIVHLNGHIVPVEKWYSDGNIKLSGLDNVWKLKGSLVTSTEIPSTDYNLVRFSIGARFQMIDTTTLFQNNVHDRIANGRPQRGFSVEATHDIEVFHVLRKSPKIFVTLKRKRDMQNEVSRIPSDYNNDINVYLILSNIGVDGVREWMMYIEPISFFRQIYDTPVRLEAVRRRSRSRSRSKSNERQGTTGGRKKQKKRRTRRLRVKTNKSKKTRFRYSRSYRK